MRRAVGVARGLLVLVWCVCAHGAHPGALPTRRQPACPQRLRGGKDDDSGKLEESVDIETMTVRELVDRVKELQRELGVSSADRVVIAYQVGGKRPAARSVCGVGDREAVRCQCARGTMHDGGWEQLLLLLLLPGSCGPASPR